MIPLHIMKCFRPSRQCFNKWSNLTGEFSSISNSSYVKVFSTCPTFQKKNSLLNTSRPLMEKKLSFPLSSYRSVSGLPINLKATVSQMLAEMKNVKSSPSAPLILGLTGLIPFVAPPFYFLVGDYYDLNIAYSQIAYGAVVMSFLGGVRWGFTLPENSSLHPEWKNLCSSVAPSIAAWISLLFPLPLATLSVAAGLGGMAIYDYVMPGYPSWYKALRTLLTLISLTSLMLSLMCYLILEHDSGKSNAKK